MKEKMKKKKQTTRKGFNQREWVAKRKANTPGGEPSGPRDAKGRGQSSPNAWGVCTSIPSTNWGEDQR